MAQENAELVRLVYEEAYPRRSVTGMRQAFAEDFLWHQRPEWPGRSIYGIDEMPQLWAELDETYFEFSLVPENFVESGEHVLVTVRNSTRLRASEKRIEGTLYHVWRVQAGKLCEAWVYSDRAEALQAVGLAE